MKKKARCMKLFLLSTLLFLCMQSHVSAVGNLMHDDFMGGEGAFYFDDNGTTVWTTDPGIKEIEEGIEVGTKVNVENPNRWLGYCNDCGRPVYYVKCDLTCADQNAILLRIKAIISV